MKLTILPRYLVEARTGLILGTHLLHEEFHKILNTVKLAIDSRACTVELLLIHCGGGSQRPVCSTLINNKA